jgi:hypothetical protein
MVNQTTTAVSTQLTTETNDLTFGQAEPITSQFSSDYSEEDTANEARAKNGWLALTAYVQKAYGSPEHEPVEQGIRDLLGDLQHLCNELDLDFSELLRRAQATFDDEVLHPIG